MTKEQINTSERNKRKAIKYFESIGELPIYRPKRSYDLHHINPDWKENDIERYIQWNPEDLVVMEHNEHLRLHHLGADFYKTEEFKQKQRDSHIGRTLSEEHKRHISEGMMGEVFTEERKQNISKALKGKPKSEEHRKHLCEAQQKRWAKYHAEKGVANA